MKQDKSLKEVLQDSKRSHIDTIAQYIEGHIRENWQTVLLEKRDQLQEAYNEGGDMAYGTYLNLLFLVIHKQLKEAGLRPEPRFPGDFDISREWGEDDSERQRWMWSTVHSSNGEPLGTIVTIVFHDHMQFRVPRKPQIIALSETSKEDVVAALSLRSYDFKHALEFTVEYEEYLRSLERTE
ncbi:DUF6022 family protein [Heyndrickxia oleronia]|uniref:DUF6022 family protein n=1 Tax=Heyndrickxia oleronia TaxID=38875 RepID=UPI00203E60CD|nr:DUF6022 family protein [Heyndrickxia oleronia]MCM3240648.1 DUF6022 family protein [Heyndrickxia oleronia]